MESETPFRLALAAVFAVSMSIGGYHRWQAASGERISHREEGYLFAITLRLAGLGLWIATFAYLFFPDSVRWAHLPLPEWLRWSGAVVGAFSAWLMYWTLTSLGKNLTDTVVTRANATLVTHGPYRFVRHPFYVTAALLMLSAMLLAANWPIGACGLAVMTLLAIRTPKEEQRLVDKFGDQYRAYMSTTGRYWPRPRRR